jgi:hypothetical protein
MNIKNFRFLALSVVVFLYSGCSLDKFIIRQTGTLVDYGVISLYQESDLQIAKTALESNIKLLEGMIIGDPDNRDLRLLTCQAFSGYALGFAEDTDPQRAKQLYLRGRDHGLYVLHQNEIYTDNESKKLEVFQAALEQIGMDDIDALFWTAFAWAGWINLSLDDPQAFIDLPKVQAMMNRVMELDETYFMGAPLLFFGTVWGLKPRMLGGDPEKAKEYFEKNLEITAGKFLLTYVYYARFYAAKILDEDLYEQLLGKVRDAPDDVLPDYQLLNVIAKEKAKRLEAQKDNIF